VFFPEVKYCTDNGAMIALAGALRLGAASARTDAGGFGVRPRWGLADAGPSERPRRSGAA
jgi:N6-L-threonylcarbamoyladenine synthase